MKTSVYVFDPTVADRQSKVRGIGRYLQILKEAADDNWHFVSDVSTIPDHGIFINPFINFFQKPAITRRITDRQIGVIHDLIGLKHPHAFPPGIRGHIRIFINKQLLRSYDMIITDSQTSKKDIESVLKIPPDKIKVIYPTLPSSFWMSQPKSASGGSGDYCVYVGDGTWNKNLVQMAAAIKQADVTCMFVGKVFDRIKTVRELGDNADLFDNPWERELRIFYEAVKYDKRFIFTGYIPDSELITLYRQARLNILVSRDEGFGFSFVEAASLGCPSVLANRPIFHEVAGDAALFADCNDPDQIAEAIRRLYDDQGYRLDMANRALERSKLFSPSGFKQALQIISPL